LHGALARLYEKDPGNASTENRAGVEAHEGRSRMKKKNIGSTFDSWLREEGIYEEVSANAIKRVVARQIASAMDQKGLTKAEMARRMNTSRASLDRLLDPENNSITLTTLHKAASVVGREIRLELV
jgi:antitoxin HicB